MIIKKTWDTGETKYYNVLGFYHVGGRACFIFDNEDAGIVSVLGANDVELVDNTIPPGFVCLRSTELFVIWGPLADETFLDALFDNDPHAISKYNELAKEFPAEYLKNTI